MKKIFTLIATVLCTSAVSAQTESYVAVTASGMATEFSSVVDASGKATNVTDGKSIVTISTTNVEAYAVGGTVPATIAGTAAQDINADGTVNSWADITWKSANRSDISFYYIAGTGNPYTVLTAKEITTDGVGTGTYKADYTNYVSDGSHGMPITGLYYKFTPKVAGKMKIGVWSNKGNRNTFVVDESTKLPIAYQAEGYINGQTDADGKMKYLSADEIKAIHDAAKVDATTGVDSAPYVIGIGTQPFFGYVTFDVVAGKSYWLFHDTAQIGFQGFEFTPTTTGIENISAEKASADSRIYNLAGQQVDSSYKGLVIQNGKKFLK